MLFLTVSNIAAAASAQTGWGVATDSLGQFYFCDKVRDQVRVDAPTTQEWCEARYRPASCGLVPARVTTDSKTIYDILLVRDRRACSRRHELRRQSRCRPIAPAAGNLSQSSGRP